MELGKKIKQLRFRSQLTQEQLAERLGIAPQSVSKWENSVAMPDITLLPQIAEVFGVSIDELFDLSVDHRFNRIENRMDAEEELPQDVFCEYEEFLKTQLTSAQYKKRATELIAYLYWHRMNSYGIKAARHAKDAIRLSPGEKGCQWILQKTDGHIAWDWNIRNHSSAIEFYRGLAEANPDVRSPYLYLIDNLLADHRADEAERWLEKLCKLSDSNPVMNEIYRAHIALARFDEKSADKIIEELVAAHPDDFVCLFEAAQYYAEKCGYDKAIDCYERSFAAEPRRPRFTDELYAIADICEIRGEFSKAADTCDRILDLLENEWGLTEADDSQIVHVRERKAKLLEKAGNGMR